MQDHQSKRVAAVRNATLVVVLGLLVVSLPASAVCRLATAEAQLCQSGIAAAVAYQRQQDQSASRQSEAQAMSALLRKSGCQQAGQSGVKAAAEVIARGPVNTANGKVDVASIRLARQTYWYVAADSLSGECTVATAPAQTP